MLRLTTASWNLFFRCCQNRGDTRTQVLAYRLPDVVSDEDSTVDLRKRLARCFSIEVRNDFFLGRLLKGYAFEVEVSSGWPL